MRVLVAVEEIALRTRVERIIASRGGDAVVGTARRGSGGPAVAVVAPASADDRGLTLARELCERGARVIVLARSRDAMREVVRALPDVEVFLSQPLDEKGLARLLSQAVGAGAGHAPATAMLLKFEGCSIDLGGRTFCNADGQEVPLTHREFELLTLLASCSGRALSRDQLHNGISGRGHEPYDRSIDMLVARLRRKVEADAKRPHFILTVPGVGYKFAARVHEVDKASTAMPAVETAALPRPAERRELTVLACQIRGLLALSSRLDPEDERDLMASVRRACADVAARFRGLVAGIQGDTVLVHFGYEEVREHDPERAIRAGTELVGAVCGLGPSGALHAHIGIATGLTLVGGAPRSPEAVSATGRAVNLALHLRSAAPADSVLVTGRTRELVGDFFAYREMPPLALAEGLEPIPVWRVAAERMNAGRFDALRRAGMLELVGRRQEMELLRRRWGYAAAGAGQVMLVTGDPGIGKSRLVAEFQEEGKAESPHILRYFGSPDQTDAPFYAVIDELQRAAGFDRADTSSERVAKLASLLEQPGGPAEQGVALIADLLSLSTRHAQADRELTPRQRKELTLTALIARIQSLAARQPVLVLVEDAHWLDPTSLELISMLTEMVPRLPILVLITARPEFAAPWPAYAHMTYLTLGRLGPEDAELLAERVGGGKALPKEVMDAILAQADGVPLFIEELTKSLLESEALREGPDSYELIGAYPSHAVPKTLNGLLQARLDRLGPAKEIAQVGAVIGREFTYELLTAVCPGSEQELDGALQKLTASGLVFRRGMGATAVYTFKHVLVQDAACGTLLREPKRALHARIAEVLESQFADIAESRPEVLAHHCTEAGLIEKAAGLWGQAGQLSLARSALLEATAQLNRALAQIASLPGTAERRRLQIKLQVSLANALMHTRGYASPATKTAFDQARAYVEQAEALGEPPDDPLLLFAVIYGFWVGNYVAFNGGALNELAERFLALAEKQAATGPVMVGHRLMATSLRCSGSIAASRTHYDRAIGLYDRAAHRPLITHFGQDIRVVVLCNRAWSLWLLGHADAALADSRRAVAEAREIGQAGTLMYALAHATRTYLWTGSYATARPLVDEILGLAEEKGAAAWKAFAMMEKGSLLALTDGSAPAPGMIASGLAAWQSTGSTLWMPCYLSNLARACAGLGRHDDAARHSAEAIAAVETTKATWCEAEVHRIAGEIALAAPDPDAANAQACFERALTIARAQQAKGWELRAAMSLARLWRDQGKLRKAHALLAPVHAWFSEGFDTLDLTEAGALLGALSSRR